MDPPKDFSEESFSKTADTDISGAFSFVSTSDDHDAEITGTLESNDINGGNNKLRQRMFENKYTNSLIGNKGIGWLLEVEDEDDETFQKPLL